MIFLKLKTVSFTIQSFIFMTFAPVYVWSSPGGDGLAQVGRPHNKQPLVIEDSSELKSIKNKKIRRDEVKHQYGSFLPVPHFGSSHSLELSFENSLDYFPLVFADILHRDLTPENSLPLFKKMIWLIEQHLFYDLDTLTLVAFLEIEVKSPEAIKAMLSQCQNLKKIFSCLHLKYFSHIKNPENIMLILKDKTENQKLIQLSVKELVFLEQLETLLDFSKVIHLAEDNKLHFRNATANSLYFYLQLIKKCGFQNNVVSVSLNGLRIDERTVKFIFDNFNQLKKLEMSHCPLSKKEWHELAVYFIQSSGFSTLKELDLSHNDFGSKTLNELTYYLRYFPLSQLIKLNLSSTKLCQKGLFNILEALMLETFSPESLDLSYNSLFCKQFLSLLKRNEIYIPELKLDGNVVDYEMILSQESLKKLL